MTCFLSQKMSSVATIILLSLFSATEPKAQISDRKGLAAGLGVGFSPIVYWQREKSDVDNLQQALSINYFVGYGIDARNVFSLEIHTVIYELDFLPGYHVSQGISGVHWYHYMNDTEHSYYASLGFGHFGINSHAKNVRPNDPKYDNFGIVGGDGVGVRLGLGRQFTKSIQIGIYYIGGISSIEGAKSQHHILSVMLVVTSF